MHAVETHSNTEDTLRRAAFYKNSTCGSNRRSATRQVEQFAVVRTPHRTHSRETGATSQRGMIFCSSFSDVLVRVSTRPIIFGDCSARPICGQKSPLSGNMSRNEGQGSQARVASALLRATTQDRCISAKDRVRCADDAIVSTAPTAPLCPNGCTTPKVLGPCKQVRRGDTKSHEVGHSCSTVCGSGYPLRASNVRLSRCRKATIDVIVQALRMMFFHSLARAGTTAISKYCRQRVR